MSISNDFLDAMEEEAHAAATPTQVWIVAKAGIGTWELQGVFSTRDLSIAACKEETDCIWPMMLDVEAPREKTLHPKVEWPLREDLNPWKCKKCGWRGPEPWIAPGVCGGEIVDILDFGCPGCNESHPDFLGTEEEKQDWWNTWEDDNSHRAKEPEEGIESLHDAGKCGMWCSLCSNLAAIALESADMDNRVTYTYYPDNSKDVAEFIGEVPPCPICNDSGVYEKEGLTACIPCVGRCVPYYDAEGKRRHLDWGDTLERQEDGSFLRVVAPKEESANDEKTD